MAPNSSDNNPQRSVLLSNQGDENNQASESNLKTMPLNVELGSDENVWHLGGGIEINQIEFTYKDINDGNMA